MSDNVASVRINDETARRLDKLAKRTGRPKSGLIQEALVQYLDEQELTGVPVQRAGYTFQHRSLTEIARIIAAQLGLRLNNDDNVVNPADGQVVANTIEDFAMAAVGLGWIMSNQNINWGIVGCSEPDSAIEQAVGRLESDGSDKALNLARTGINLTGVADPGAFYEANGITESQMEQATALLAVGQSSFPVKDRN